MSELDSCVLSQGRGAKPGATVLLQCSLVRSLTFPISSLSSDRSNKGYPERLLWCHVFRAGGWSTAVLFQGLETLGSFGLSWQLLCEAYGFKSRCLTPSNFLIVPLRCLIASFLGRILAMCLSPARALATGAPLAACLDLVLQKQ